MWDRHPMTNIGGHLWTLLPELTDRLWPPDVPASVPWSLQVGGAAGPVELTGELSEAAEADTLLVVLHGLGGSAESRSSRRAALAAAQRGWSSLRVSLRGADGRGHDLYHAGLTEDVGRVVACPSARAHRRVFVYGASLGGHLALRHALDPHPSLDAVAAICPPLDLAATADAIDRGRAIVYRRAILRSLKRAYRTVAARRQMAFPVEQVEAVSRVREYDRLVVVPRFGFESVDDYYESMSVGPHLDRLRVPALYLGSLGDPMVPYPTVHPSLQSAGRPLEARVRRRGGHVGFPQAPEARVLDWLDRVG
jgi:predicted alpha/beta-fold hydrolase